MNPLILLLFPNKNILTPTKFLASEPKEPTVYHKAGKCRIHKTTRLKKDSHVCCDCCCGGGCEPDYTCPKCETLYAKKHNIWFNKFGHIVMVGERMEVKNGRILKMRHDIRMMQFLHGGKPIKKGKWAKINEKTGLLQQSRTKTNMIVVG